MNKAEFLEKWANGRLAEIEADLDALMNPPKAELKVGDKCRVIANLSGHEFEIGEIVTITYDYTHDPCPHFECTKGDEWWYLTPDELEKIES